MQVSRRGFVQSLMGATAGAAFLATLGPSAAIGADVPSWPSADPQWPATFDGVLREAARIFGQQWREARAQPWELSDRVLPLRELTTQINTGFETGQALGNDPINLLEAAIRCLALTAIEDGIGVFSRLELPRAVEYAGESGPLRMVVCWDPMLDRWITRFDVRGRSTRPRIEDVARRRYSMRGMALSILSRL